MHDLFAAFAWDASLEEIVPSAEEIEKRIEHAPSLKTVAGRIPGKKVRIVLVGDGASWLWQAMRDAFPGGREVLDYYHCSQHIHALAQAQYAGNPQKALIWVEATMARLSQKGGPSYVIGALRRMSQKITMSKS